MPVATHAPTTRAAMIAATIALLGAAGCSSNEQAAYPVEFQVLVAGKPASGATVVLHPVGGAAPDKFRPAGKADDTGTVRLSTFAHHDGAPAGEYAVTVAWYEQTSTPDQAVVLGKDRLKGKHLKPDPAAPRVTVKKETNQLPALQL